eukprot:symbB.v1.2.029414.t1/scaffold3211.1/size107887/6
MGKGGYGKGWSRGKPWQNGRQQWRHHYPAQQNYQQWHHTYQHQPAEPSLGRLCTGVLSSAWEGLCSGVTAATLKAVEHTANAFLKPKTEQQVEKEKVEDHGAKSIMACLAGKSAEPVPATEKAAEKAPASMPDQLMLSVLELQREQMQQQTLFQQQLLCLQNASLAPSAAAEQTSEREKAITCDPQEDQSSKECSDYPHQLSDGKQAGNQKGYFQEAACEERSPCTAGHVA